MRKDVKLGLAIGAVLLAVVIVWAAVPRHSAKPGVVINKTTTDTGGGSAAPQTPPQNDVPPSAPPAQSQPIAPAPAPDGGTTAGGSDTPKPPTDTHTTSTNWAALLTANDEQLPALIGQHTTPAAPADHPISGDLPPDGDVVPAAQHGGMTPDDLGSHPTTMPMPSDQRATARTHTVQSGETLASIAKSVYGKSGMYLAIEKANPGINANRLKVGTVLKLPESTAPSASASADSEAITPTHGHHARTESTVDSTKEYRVQPGDSLHKISVKLYGTAARADEIYTTNKDTIGDDPAKLKVGEVLKLPEPATASASR
jgi:nucleoid-associated protein YgaU